LPDWKQQKANEAKVEKIREAWGKGLQEYKETVYLTYDAQGNVDSELPMKAWVDKPNADLYRLEAACLWRFPNDAKAYERVLTELKAKPFPEGLEAADAVNAYLRSALYQWSKEVNAYGIREVLVVEFCQRHGIETGYQLMTLLGYHQPKQSEIIDVVRHFSGKLNANLLTKWQCYCQQNKETTGFVFTKNEFFYRATVIFLSECEKKTVSLQHGKND
jgi:hypothetical protein